MSLYSRTQLTSLEFQEKPKMFETAGVRNNGACWCTFQRTKNKQTNKFMRLIEATSVNFYLRDAQLFPSMRKFLVFYGLLGSCDSSKLFKENWKMQEQKGKG